MNSHQKDSKNSVIYTLLNQFTHKVSVDIGNRERSLVLIIQFYPQTKNRLRFISVLKMSMFGRRIQDGLGNKASTSRSLCDCLWVCRYFLFWFVLVSFGLWLFFFWYFQNWMRMCSYSSFHFFILKMYKTSLVFLE